MNSKIAKKIRQYAKKEYVDLFRALLDLPLRERVKLAFRLVFRR
jgi:hypothetical protein